MILVQLSNKSVLKSVAWQRKRRRVEERRVGREGGRGVGREMGREGGEGGREGGTAKHVNAAGANILGYTQTEVHTLVSHLL